MPRLSHTSPQTLRLFAALIAEPDRWRYGYDLSRETGLASGTLYPILMRLTDQEMLEAGWEVPQQKGRPTRHIYRLSPDGRNLARARLAAASERAGVRPNLAAGDA